MSGGVRGDKTRYLARAAKGREDSLFAGIDLPASNPAPWNAGSSIGPFSPMGHVARTLLAVPAPSRPLRESVASGRLHHDGRQQSPVTRVIGTAE